MSTHNGDIVKEVASWGGWVVLVLAWSIEHAFKLYTPAGRKAAVDASGNTCCTDGYQLITLYEGLTSKNVN